MSIKHMTAVWDYSLQSGSMLLMLLALADYANDQGIAAPRVRALAKRSRLGYDQANRVLLELEREQEIAIVRSPGIGNIYHLIGYTSRVEVGGPPAQSPEDLPRRSRRSSRVGVGGSPLKMAEPPAQSQEDLPRRVRRSSRVEVGGPPAQSQEVLVDSLKKKKKLINLNNNIQESSSSANEIDDQTESQTLVIKANETVQRIVANLGLFGKYSANILKSETISPARIAGCLAYAFDRENKIRNHLAVAAANATNGFVIPEKYNGWSAWKRYIPEQYLDILRPDLPVIPLTTVEETEVPELYGEIILPTARAFHPDELDNYVRIQEAVITDVPKPTVEIVLNTWLYDLGEDSLVVATDNEHDQEWLTARLKTSMERTAVGVLNRTVQVSFRKVDP